MKRMEKLLLDSKKLYNPSKNKLISGKKQFLFTVYGKNACMSDKLQIQWSKRTQQNDNSNKNYYYASHLV